MSHQNGFRVVAIGERAILVVAGESISDETSKRVFDAMNAIARDFDGVVFGLVPAYTTLLGRIRPQRDGASELAKKVERHLKEIKQGTTVARDAESSVLLDSVVEIPVCYGDDYGPDLEEVANGLSMPPESVIRTHSESLYRVAMMGFMPGFAYLTGMPDAIAYPRKSTPRLRVPAGSVGIGGLQTGAYALASPGGWQIIGRTPSRLFRPFDSDSTLLHTGDYVRFVPISEGEFLEQEQKEQVRLATENRTTHIRTENGKSTRTVSIVKAGLLTTIQDLGRQGYESIGISTSGAMDFFAAAVANLLVGNRADDALLECTLVGPHLRFNCDALVAVTGANLRPLLDGRPIALWQSVQVKKGSELVFSGYQSGVRAYVAVSGGVDVPKVMGSRATDMGASLGGLMGRALANGDELLLARETDNGLIRPGRMLHPRLRPTYDKVVRLSFLRSLAPSGLPKETVSSFTKSTCGVLPQSDRMGIRLQGWTLNEELEPTRGSVISEPVLMGTIQCPVNGTPVILMADAQTIGGYPTLGTVAQVDLPRLAQAAPGSEVVFQLTSEEEARARLLKAYQILRWLSLANGFNEFS